MPSYTLVNAEKRADRYPDDFKIPDRLSRERLEPGYHVKLIFENGRDGERMWVLVQGVEDKNHKTTYVGELRNEPVQLRDVKHGDRVVFGPEHVADIQVGTDG